VCREVLALKELLHPSNRLGWFANFDSVGQYLDYERRIDRAKKLDFSMCAFESNETRGPRGQRYDLDHYRLTSEFGSKYPFLPTLCEWCWMLNSEGRE